jgi:O-antigen ligase
VFTNIVLALTCRGWLARAALRCLIGAAILGTPAIFAGSHLQGKVTQAISETVQTLKGEQGGMTSEIRLAMWRASLDGWRESPIIGVGLGGTPSIMRTTTITTPAVDLKTVRMIHSTYIMALVDTGLVGLGLFLGFAALLFGDTLRGLRGQPLLVASFGALVVWFVAAAFDGYQQSGGFLSVGAILIPLALADLREDAQPTGNSSPTA